MAVLLEAEPLQGVADTASPDQGNFATLVFFNRAERDLRRVDHLVDVRSRFGLLTGLGQQPGDIVLLG
jgi:hypothetical protein